MQTQAQTPQMTTQDGFFPAAEKVEQEVITKSEQVAQDDRFSPAYKQDELRKNVNEALEWINKQAEVTERLLNQQIERLTPLAAVHVSPSLEEAAALSYTKDVVMGQWQQWAQANRSATLTGQIDSGFGGTVSRAMPNVGLRYPVLMKEAWEVAIKSGDKITARVYRDFAEGFIRQQRNMTPEESLSSPLLSFIPEFQEKTLDTLRNDEQRKAAKQLTQARYDLKELKMVVNGARFRLGNARFEAGGKVTVNPRINIQF